MDDEIIDDESIVKLENGLFMVTTWPSNPEDGEVWELPKIAPPGSSLEKYCREVYEKKLSSEDKANEYQGESEEIRR